MSSIKYISENTPFIISAITSENFVSDLDYSGHTVGEIVCYSSLYNDLINRFGSYENAKEIWSLCRSLINNGQYYEYFLNNGCSVPYIDVDLYLEEEVVDNGLFTPVIEKWVSGKKYHVGDMVYYSIDGTDENMIPYVLTNGKTDMLMPLPSTVYQVPKTTTKTLDVTGTIYIFAGLSTVVINGKYYTIETVTEKNSVSKKEKVVTLTFKENVNPDNVRKDDIIYKSVKDSLYDRIEISYSIYESYRNDPNLRNKVETLNGKYYIKVETYTGYFDERTQLLYFDDLDDNGNLQFNHWVKAETLVETYPIEDTANTYETVTESLLLSVKRRKTSMDDSSNILPFIPHYIKSVDGLRFYKYQLDTGTTEMFYMIGIAKTDVNPNGTITCDYLKSITFTNEDGSATLSYTDSNHKNMEILCNDDFNIYTNVIFEYYIGANLDDNGNFVDGTGVKYVEVRSFTVEHMDVTIDKTLCNDLPYFNISEEYYFAKDENEDLANSGHGTSFADVSLAENQIGKTPFSDIKIVKDERLNSVQDFIEEVDVNIDRGIATSFERHNALGEINTMQDLEHYRNDFFDVSKQ